MCLCIILFYSVFFFFKQKTAYELRISDWSSDVCSSDLGLVAEGARLALIGDGRSGHAMRAPMEPMIVAKPGKLVPIMHAESTDTGCSLARPDRKSVV